MAAGQTGNVIGEVRRVLARDGGGLSDGQLLECFLARRDEAAFEALLRRHGPMVLGVCRRLLRHQQDAEDAFQATFLVLARKGESVRPREMVGNWLYGVACRTALELRKLSARRRAREKQVDDMPHPTRTVEVDPDLAALLDEELSRLPGRYRAPVVLCELAGRTRRDAAQQLGVPEGTLSSRLARGKEMLRKRLARRGLAPCAATLAGLLGNGAATAAVPSGLLGSTLRAAAGAVVGQPAAMLPARVDALTERVVTVMLLQKLKIGAVVFLALAVGGVSAGVLTYRAWGDEKPRPGDKAVAREADPPPAQPVFPREALRYDGKSFAQWRTELRTELKPERRAEAVRALGTFGAHGYGKEATATILELVKGYDRRFDTRVGLVMNAADSAMGKIGQPAAPALLAALEDERQHVRHFAARALDSAGPFPKSAAPALLRATKSKDAAIRQAAIGALPVDADPGEIVPPLIAALKDEESSIRLAAAGKLREIGPPAKEAIPALLALLNERPADDPRFGGRSSRRSGRGSDPTARQEAVYALQKVGAESEVLVPALVQALTDPDGSVVSAAADVFSQLGPRAKAAVPALIEAFNKGNVQDRTRIARVLGAMGPAAKDAVPALTAALQDPFGGSGSGIAAMRREVAEALKQITGDEPIPPDDR